MPYYEHMFKEHNISPDTLLWRYMDLSKFLNIIDKQGLYFTRADKFEDPYEGMINSITKQNRRLQYPHLNESFHVFNDNLSIYKQKFTGVSCWHESDHESAAMWNLYLKSGEGIAIQTNFQDFCNSLHNEEKEVYIGRVSYVDFETDILDDTSFNPFMYKRKSFSHEKEIRAIYHEAPLREDGWANWEAEPVFEHGIQIKVDLNILINKIYIAPTSPPYLKELLESILKKYELNKEVIQSNLYKSPIIK